MVRLDPESFQILEARLKKEGGALEFSGGIARGGARPEVEVSGRIHAMPLYSLVGPDFRDYVEGTISGDLRISGSTNTQSGVEAAVQVELDEGDEVVLRDRFSLLRAISAIDRLRSYKKVRFTVGRFNMRTGGNQMEISDIRLDSQELMRLEGGFVVRPPSREEMKEELDIEKSPVISARVEEGDEALEPDEIDLRAAVEAARAAEEEEAGEQRDAVKSLILDTQMGGEQLAAVEEMAWQRERDSYILDGTVRIGLTKDVLARAEGLDQAYPVDEETGMRWLKVRLNGRIYEAGAELADSLLPSGPDRKVRPDQRPPVLTPAQGER